MRCDKVRGVLQKNNERGSSRQPVHLEWLPQCVRKCHEFHGCLCDLQEQRSTEGSKPFNFEPVLGGSSHQRPGPTNVHLLARQRKRKKSLRSEKSLPIFYLLEPSRVHQQPGRHNDVPVKSSLAAFQTHHSYNEKASMDCYRDSLDVSWNYGCYFRYGARQIGRAISSPSGHSCVDWKLRRYFLACAQTQAKDYV